MCGMPEDRQAILAVILAVKRGFVSPEEGMKLLEQAEAEVAAGPVDSNASTPPQPRAEETIYQQVPEEQREQLRRETAVLAADTVEAAKVLEEAGVSEEVQQTLLDLGSQSPQDIEATLLSLSPRRATTIIERPQAKPPTERYKLLREHARGGMGRILVALDTTVGREVALKELLPGRGGSTTGKSGAGSVPTDASTAAVARFMREATVTAQLEHPNIVPVYEIGTRDDGSLYYTMKFVRGRTLATRLRAIRNDPDLSPTQKMAERMKLLDAFVDVCNAIAFSHSRGVIHRDIKPANIMLGDYGEALVLDWGLAGVREKEEISFANGTPVSDSQASDLTLEGEVMGTPAYMAPEQAAGKLNEVDERSDIYSLGAVLYEIVTGEPPYRGKSAKDVLSSVLSERPRQISVVTPDAPPELAALVMRALAREPEDRYQNAKELAEQVQAYRDGRMVSVYRYSAMELLTRFVAKHRAAVTVSVLALLLLIAGGVYGYQRVVDERDSALAAERDALNQRTIAEQQAVEAERQKKIAEDEAAEADRQEGIARDKAKEAEEQKTAAQLAAKKALEEEERANREADAAKASAVKAQEQTELARKRFEQAQRNLAEAHLGYVALARERRESGKELVHLAAAHKADASTVSKGRLLGALKSRTFPLWRTRSYIDLPAGRATFSKDRKLCAAAMHRPPQSVAEFNKNAESSILADVGIWDLATGTLLRRISSVEAERRLLFSDDASRLIAIESNGALRMWDVATGEELVHRSAHAWGGTPQIAAAGPDTFFTAVSDGKVCEWLIADGSAVREFEAPEFTFSSLAVSPDGKYLAAGDVSKGVMMWDLTQVSPPATLNPDESVLGLAFTTEGLLVVKSWSETEVWDYTLTEKLRSYDSLSSWYVTNTEISTDGKSILIGMGQNGWRLVDAETGKTLASRGSGGGHVLGATISPDSSAVVVALRGEGFDFIGANGTGLIERAPEHVLGSLTLEVSPDGQYYASGDYSGRLLLRRVVDGTTAWFNKISSSEIRRVAYSPDGSLIAVYGAEGVLSFVNATTGKMTRYLKQPLFGFGIEFSPDGDQVCAATPDGEVLIINTATAEIERRLRLPSELNVIGVEFDPNEDRVWLLDSRLSQWSWRWRVAPIPVKDGVFYYGGSTSVYAMNVSPDGKVMVLGTDSGEVFCWETGPFATRFHKKIGPGPIINCAFGTSSEYFVCGTADGMLCYVDARSGNVIHRQRANPAAVVGVAVTPDGRNIITSGVDGEFLAWQTPSFLRPNMAQAGMHSASELALSPDGKLAAIAVDNGIVKLIDAESLETKGEFQCLPHMITDLEFSRDGRLLAASNSSGEVLTWDVEAVELIRTHIVHDSVSAVGFDSEGNLVVNGTYYGLQLRNPRTGELVLRFRDRPGLTTLSMFPHGIHAFQSGYEVDPRIVELVSGQTVAELPRSAVFPQVCGISKDGKRMALVRDRGKVAIHDTETGERLTNLSVRGGTVRALMFLAGNERLVCVFDNRVAVLVDATTGDELDVTWFGTTMIADAVMSDDGQFILVSGYAGEVERWELKREVSRLQELASLDVDTILTMTQVMTGIKLDNLKAIPLPRETGNVTWLTEDGLAPEFLRGDMPGWIPRFVGANVAAARDFLGRNSQRRDDQIDELAEAWQDQFEGYRYKEVLTPDLSTERVTLPPRPQDEDGNYLGEPEGDIDYRGWLRDQRERARQAITDRVEANRIKADRAMKNGEWRLAQHYYRLMIRLQPSSVDWALGYAEACLNLGESWSAIAEISPHLETASKEQQASIQLMWGRNLAWDYDYPSMLERFESARKAGYKNPDWHLYRVKAMERFGAYDEATGAVQAALIEVSDGTLRAELSKVGARCQVWSQLRRVHDNLPAILVASVPAGSTLGLQRGDAILNFRVEGADQYGGPVANEFSFLSAWERYARTSDEHLNEAILTVRRNGEELEVKIPRGKLDVELFALRPRN